MPPPNLEMVQRTQYKNPPRLEMLPSPPCAGASLQPLSPNTKPVVPFRFGVLRFQQVFGGRLGTPRKLLKSLENPVISAIVGNLY